MENEKNPQIQPEQDWIDDILAAPAASQEIGPDEQAVSSAGLIHHEDAELERIIHEAKAMDTPHGEEDFFDIPAILENCLQNGRKPVIFLDQFPKK